MEKDKLKSFGDFFKNTPEPKKETPEVKPTEVLTTENISIPDSEVEKVVESKIDITKPEIEPSDSLYKVYKDKAEIFSCDIQVEGANINDTYARLILETEEWTLVFKGTINEAGKCEIPIKKLSILEEGKIGTLRLEIIAEDNVFCPYEDEFKVCVDKKIDVKKLESKSITPKVTIKK
jgi:hypothetical protein